jgi:photosystem II stability/assembly factor-like uncharacterized protein
MALKKTGIPLNDFWISPGYDPADPNTLEIFAIGDGGVILHYYNRDGLATTPNVWVPMCSGTIRTLRAIWGSSRNNIFVCGGDQYATATGDPASVGFILHFDGTSWTNVYSTTAPLYDIDGSSSADVICVGGKNPGYYWDWSTLPPSWQYSRSGPGKMEIHQFNGTAWAAMNLHWSLADREGCKLNSVWTSPLTQQNKVTYAVGDYGTILVLDYDPNGSLWYLYEGYNEFSLTGGTPHNWTRLKSVWAKSAPDNLSEDAYVGGETIDQWSTPAAAFVGNPFLSIVQTSGRYILTKPPSPNPDILMAWETNYYQAFSGGSWVPEMLTNMIWGSSKEVVFAASDDQTILQLKWPKDVPVDPNTSWFNAPTGASLVGNVIAIAGIADDIIFFLASNSNFYEWNGAQINDTVFKPFLTSNYIAKVWGASATDVYAVGGAPLFPIPPNGSSGLIAHFDGTDWQIVDFTGDLGYDVPHSFESVWGPDGNTVYVVGHNGTILKNTSGTWSQLTSGTTRNLYGVWGTDANNVYAVGDAGLIIHTTDGGATWVREAQTISISNLRGIWGNSTTNIYVVGDEGRIFHYNGSWTEIVHSATRLPLWDIWGVSNTNIFACGEQGTVIHWDGTTWTAFSGAEFDAAITNPFYGRKADLRAVWGSPELGFFVLGWDTIIANYNGVTWSSVSSCMPVEWLGMWGSSGTQGYIVGGWGTILRFNANATQDNQ